MTPSRNTSQCHKYWVDGRSHVSNLIVTPAANRYLARKYLTEDKLIVPDYVRGGIPSTG